MIKRLPWHLLIHIDTFDFLLFWAFSICCLWAIGLFLAGHLVSSLIVSIWCVVLKPERRD